MSLWHTQFWSLMNQRLKHFLKCGIFIFFFSSWISNIQRKKNYFEVIEDKRLLLLSISKINVLTSKRKQIYFNHTQMKRSSEKSEYVMPAGLIGLKYFVVFLMPTANCPARYLSLFFSCIVSRYTRTHVQRNTKQHTHICGDYFLLSFSIQHWRANIQTPPNHSDINGSNTQLWYNMHTEKILLSLKTMHDMNIIAASCCYLFFLFPFIFF